MNQSVPYATIFMICLNMLLGVLIPVVLCIIIRRKFGGELKAFFIGCGTMLLFAYILEGAVNTIIFASPLGASLTSNIWLYGLFGGFMAGLFEETGRLAAFKTILKKNQGNDGNALMYGAGHGGFETFYILVIGMINNLIYAALINSGATGLLTEGLEGAQLQAVENIFAQLCEASPLLFLAGSAERLIAITFHVSASVLVWYAAKNGGNYILLYPLAILLHLLLDAIAVILNSYGINPWLLEAVVLIFSIAVALLAGYIWKREKRKNYANLCNRRK